MVSMLAMGCPAPVVEPEPIEEPPVEVIPRYGGRLVVAMGSEPPTMDNTHMTCAPAATVSRLIAPPLIDQDKDGSPLPYLAESWEFSPDALTLTLYLRRNVKFHDGTPFNAEAAKFNLDRFLRPGVPFRFLIDRIIEVEVVDEYTVNLHLSEPFAPILLHLSHEFVAIHSPTAVKAPGPDGVIENPVGTGPFKLAEWIHGERLVLVANENYWGGRPYLDEIVFEIVPEIGARVAMLEAGDAHMAWIVPPHDAPRLEADPAITVLRKPGPRMIYLGLNNQLPPFDDVRVRHAINYAIDREAIVDRILLGVGEVADAPIAPGIFGHHPVGPWPYNPERARELLAEAGFPDGFDTVLLHPTGRYMMDVAVAEAIHAMLADVGIRARLVTKEWAAFLAFLTRPVEEAVVDPAVEMFFIGWGTITGDADYGLYMTLHPDMWVPVGRNRVFYYNRQVGRLLEEARAELNPDKRAELYAQAIELIWADAPWGFLYVEGMISATRANVHGVYLHPIGEIPRFEKAWVE
ncbi:glutathione ABC transporter substrate-binding protein [Dehalococcoidia bacterium]|nr:glutathione ABC transporter substrate-binding protein [Dehalococcoidia bacterium]